MEETECSEMSAYKLQTPGNYPKESIQRTEHGESLKSRSPHYFTQQVHSCWKFRRNLIPPTSVYGWDLLKFYVEAPKKNAAVRDITLCKHLPVSTFR